MPAPLSVDSEQTRKRLLDLFDYMASGSNYPPAPEQLERFEKAVRLANTCDGNEAVLSAVDLDVLEAARGTGQSPKLVEYVEQFLPKHKMKFGIQTMPKR